MSHLSIGFKWFYIESYRENVRMFLRTAFAYMYGCLQKQKHIETYGATYLLLSIQTDRPE